MMEPCRYQKEGIISSVGTVTDGFRAGIAFTPFIGEKLTLVIINSEHFQLYSRTSKLDQSIMNISYNFLHDMFKCLDINERKSNNTPSEYILTRSMINSLLDGNNSQKMCDDITTTFYNTILYLHKKGLVPIKDIKKAISIIPTERIVSRHRNTIKEEKKKKRELSLELSKQKRRMSEILTINHFSLEKMILRETVDKYRKMEKLRSKEWSSTDILESVLISSPTSTGQISKTHLWRILNRYSKLWYTEHSEHKKDGKEKSLFFIKNLKKSEINGLVRKRMEGIKKGETP
ncbi:MAG TPA: hypothetical protein PLV42_05495 [bacterium]|nr:hypothetical protein [bacterium]